MSRQGLLQAIGQLLIWGEWARNLVRLLLCIGVQVPSQLGRFIGFLQYISNSLTTRNTVE